MSDKDWDEYIKHEWYESQSEYPSLLPSEMLPDYKLDTSNVCVKCLWDCYGIKDNIRDQFKILENIIGRTCTDAKCQFYKLPKTITLKEKNYVFITLQDFKRRLSDLDKLLLFIKRIGYMYDNGIYVIETGKSEKEEDFNIHIHLLVKIGNHVKNHKEVMNLKWMALFDTNLYDKDYYKLDQHRRSKKMPHYEDWLVEKRDYFVNDLKGTHKNTIDLGLAGTFGYGTTPGV